MAPSKIVKTEIRLLTHQMEFMTSKERYTIDIAGRGAGKSFVLGHKCTQLVKDHKDVIISAPTYKTLKKVLIPAVLDAMYQTNMTGYSYNKTDNEILWRGRRITGISDESFESARGFTGYTALLMDEAALCSKEARDVWSACLRGGGPPEHYYITTPRGADNWLMDFIDRPNTKLIHATTYDNQRNLSKEFIEDLESTYDGNFARQELMAEILKTDSAQQLLPSQLVDDAFERENPPPENVRLYRTIAGLDVAGSGEDRTVLTIRRGPVIMAIYKWQGADTVELEKALPPLLTAVDHLYVDSIGIGWGIANILKDRGPCPVTYVNSGKSCMPSHRNMRALLWSRLREWLKFGALPADMKKELRKELISMRYWWGNSNEMCLEMKKDLKARGLCSPDISDSIVFSLMEDFEERDTTMEPYNSKPKIVIKPRAIAFAP